MQEMYKGVVNSPETTITNDISNTDTIIYILDETRVPDELPNLMTLGTGTAAETIKVLSVNGNALTVERGFQGVAKAWNAGTIIARNFTEYDYNALKENIEDLEATKETPEGAQEKADAALNSAKQYTDQEVGEVSQDIAAHKAEDVTQGDAPHGMVYEEGTWTPSYATTESPFDTITYAEQTGKYVRIGNMVTVLGTIRTANIIKGSASGDLIITGLPFVPLRGGSITVGHMVRFGSNFNINGAFFSSAHVGFYIAKNETDGARTHVLAQDLRDGVNSYYNFFTFSATYII